MCGCKWLTLIIVVSAEGVWMNGWFVERDIPWLEETDLIKKNQLRHNLLRNTRCVHVRLRVPPHYVPGNQGVTLHKLHNQSFSVYPYTRARWTPLILMFQVRPKHQSMSLGGLWTAENLALLIILTISMIQSAWINSILLPTTKCVTRGLKRSLLITLSGMTKWDMTKQLLNRLRSSRI